MAMLYKNFMQRALGLAERGAGWTSPNPMVGCVIVCNGKIIAQGFHESFGGEHAEIQALRDARRKKKDVRGATMVVTLEPCTVVGKTPPCVDAILRSGIAEVVIATEDPNPHVHGRGVARLRAAGVVVRVGILRKAAQEQNRIFFHWITHRMPYVIAKVAVSRDNKITHVVGKTTHVSSQASDRFTHALRQRCDAMLVGVNTVRIDNPQLTVRGIPHPKHPVPIILDPEFSIPRTARVFQHHHPIIITATLSPRDLARTAEIKKYKLTRGVLPLRKILRDLAHGDISSILVEGGQYTLTRFFDIDVVDEWILIRSHKTFGGGMDFIEHPEQFTKKFRLSQSIRSSTDVIECYYPRRVAS